MKIDYGKILKTMVAHREREWFFPPDFMRVGGELFVGYEASARFSEMAKRWPSMIDSRRNGKYVERRIRYETIAEWWPLIPEELQVIFAEAGIGPTPILAV